MDYTIGIDDPRGFPDSIARDLERAESSVSDTCDIGYDEEENKVTIEAEGDEALEELYDWLTETMRFYKEEFVDASGEYRAAQQMEEKVYEVKEDDFYNTESEGDN